MRTFDAAARDVQGPLSTVLLTASQSALLCALFLEAGAIVLAERRAHALCGDRGLDCHARAALRSHVYTLHGRLAAAGVDDAIEVRRGVGYRLVVEDAR